MKLIEYFLPFQIFFFEFQTSLLVFEIQVCKIKTFHWKLEFIFKISKVNCWISTFFLKCERKKFEIEGLQFLNERINFVKSFDLKEKRFYFWRSVFEFQKTFSLNIKLHSLKFNDSSLTFKD